MDKASQGGLVVIELSSAKIGHPIILAFLGLFFHCFTSGHLFQINRLEFFYMKQYIQKKMKIKHDLLWESRKEHERKIDTLCT